MAKGPKVFALPGSLPKSFCKPGRQGTSRPRMNPRLPCGILGRPLFQMTAVTLWLGWEGIPCDRVFIASTWHWVGTIGTAVPEVQNAPFYSIKFWSQAVESTLHQKQG
jgi:hypothetical protein